jgi:hypothetical protein
VALDLPRLGRRPSLRPPPAGSRRGWPHGPPQRDGAKGAEDLGEGTRRGEGRNYRCRARWPPGRGRTHRNQSRRRRSGSHWRETDGFSGFCWNTCAGKDEAVGGSSVFSRGSSINWNKIVDVVFCGKWTRFRMCLVLISVSVACICMCRFRLARPGACNEA